MTNIGERIGNIFYQRHARISNDRKVIGLDPRIGNGSRNFFSVLINTRIKCNFDISSSDRQTRIFLRALSDSPLCGNDPRPFSNRALTAISPGLGTSLVTIFLEISQDSREMRVNFSSNFHSTKSILTFDTKSCFFFHLFFTDFNVHSPFSIASLHFKGI